MLPLLNNKFQNIKKKIENISACMPNILFVCTKFHEKYSTFCVACVKGTKKCLTKSHFGASQFLFFTQVTQNICFSSKLGRLVLKKTLVVFAYSNWAVMDGASVDLFGCMYTRIFYSNFFDFENFFFLNNGSIYSYESKHPLSGKKCVVADGQVS